LRSNAVTVPARRFLRPTWSAGFASIRVVDLKTSARKYTDLPVETALQLSVYSYAVGLSPFANGDDVRLRFDVLTKTKQPELCRYWTTRDRAANVRLFRLVSEVLGAVEAGRVSPDRRLAVQGLRVAEQVLGVEVGS